MRSGEFPASIFPFSALTSLAIRVNRPVSLEWLSRCTALRRIASFGDQGWVEQLPALPGLRKINLQASAELLQRLQCTQLTRLCVQPSALGELLKRGWPFGSLRKLSIREPTTRADIESAQSVADLARLRSVTLVFDFLTHNEAAATRETFPSLLRHLQSRGVEETPHHVPRSPAPR